MSRTLLYKGSCSFGTRLVVITVTEEAGQSSGKGKKSADSEEDPDVQESTETKHSSAT